MLMIAEEYSKDFWFCGGTCREVIFAENKISKDIESG